MSKVVIFTDVHLSDRGSMMRSGMRRDYVKKFIDWLVRSVQRGIVYGISGGVLTSSDHLSATEISALLS